MATRKVPTTANVPARKDRLDLFAISLLAVLCGLLGIGQVAMKVANDGISPLLQAGLRSAGACLLLGAWSALRGIRLFERDGTLLPLLAVSLLFTLEFALLYPGLARTTASRAVILLYTSPFVVAVGAHFFIPGDRLTWTRAIGLVCALVGVMTVLAGREGGGQSSLAGDLLCLGAGVSWGALTVIARGSRLAASRPERVIFVQLGISGVLLTGLSYLMGEAGITNPSPLVIGAFIYTVVFVGFITFTTSFWLMTRYPASRIMAFLMLTPVFGVAAGVLLLSEPLTPHLLIGLVVVIAGLWLVNRPTT